MNTLQKQQLDVDIIKYGAKGLIFWEILKLDRLGRAQWVTCNAHHLLIDKAIFRRITKPCCYIYSNTLHQYWSHGHGWVLHREQATLYTDTDMTDRMEELPIYPYNDAQWITATDQLCMPITDPTRNRILASFQLKDPRWTSSCYKVILGTTLTVTEQRVFTNTEDALQMTSICFNSKLILGIITRLATLPHIDTPYYTVIASRLADDSVDHQQALQHATRVNVNPITIPYQPITMENII